MFIVKTSKKAVKAFENLDSAKDYVKDHCGRKYVIVELRF